jgi:hypothetical protein
MLTDREVHECGSDAVRKLAAMKSEYVFPCHELVSFGKLEDEKASCVASKTPFDEAEVG